MNSKNIVQVKQIDKIYFKVYNFKKKLMTTLSFHPDEGAG